MKGPAIVEAARSTVLRVPATTDALTLVRLFATSIGRHLDLSPETVEDLKLALTEVCSAAVEAAHSGDDALEVAVTWSFGPSDVVVRVSASRSFSTGDPASDDRARLLDALGLRLVVAGNGHGVEFAVSTSPSP